MFTIPAELGVPQWVLMLAVMWELAWKGVGMWFAARNNQAFWYVGILLLNTLGILPILYLLFFRADRKTNRSIGGI